MKAEDKKHADNKILIGKIPASLPVIPVRNTVFFPKQVMPLTVGRDASVYALGEAEQTNTPILVLAQRDGEIEKPSVKDLYHVGTIARIVKVFTLPDGSKNVVLQGLFRARMVTVQQTEPFLKMAVQRIDDESIADTEMVDALASSVRSEFHRIVDLSREFSEEHLSVILNIEEPGSVADVAAAMVTTPVQEKQEILETFNVQKRLELVLRLLNTLVQRLELGSKIQSDVRDEINKSQREFYLRQQLKAIQKELGEDGENVDMQDLRERLKKGKLPGDTEKTVEKELDRLAKMNPSSAEYTVSRTYIEWLLDLPWSVSTEDNLDIGAAEQVLNRDHYGLDKVKKRILEYLAVRKLKRDMRGPILCFIGPPGVGKTSLGKSIARALGRNFMRMSLGGVRDEAEIRGHRRTYIGALPGRIIQGIKKAGSNNPVFMLDEIDKIGMDFRGDPASALLEVLDPEQNSTFSDHYLEVPFDLSKVLFIATGNMLDTIPAPLRDRMEIIEMPSYIEEEKLRIATDYLVPKQVEAHGLEVSHIAFTDDAIRRIIRSYTKEAGVRTLERKLADICRGVARRVAEGDHRSTEITVESLPAYLGAEKFYSEVSERVKRPGIATGLAWTPVGGDILFIEATKMKGKGRLTLTGQLGEIMKESAQAALSYISAYAGELEIDEDFREKIDIHIHVPAGAIPKDGPSAGVTMLSALVSLLADRPVRNDLAMTGEITLRGAVLPVGGIKEKMLAAHRAGIKYIILPERNKKDIDELPAGISASMEFSFVSEMSEVIKAALRGDPKKKKQIRSDEFTGFAHQN